MLTIEQRNTLRAALNILNDKGVRQLYLSRGEHEHHALQAVARAMTNMLVDESEG